MDKWIPVEERLPDEWGEYLVMYHEWSDGNFLPKREPDDYCSRGERKGGEQNEI